MSVSTNTSKTYPKLSEAIKKGAKGTVKARLSYFETDPVNHKEIVGACVLGAAFMGVTGKRTYTLPTDVFHALHTRLDPNVGRVMIDVTTLPYEVVQRLTPNSPLLKYLQKRADALATGKTYTPLTYEGDTVNVFALMMELNDFSDMSREEIADLIAQLGY